ncbi:MAG: RecX family transcriptional regulator [Bacteroidales bacterium]|nr:RecX family transcriptional regulator [Bacteroidales bacterium]MCF8404151.1 RecX family transcriptional regulator [Bacteroidales bacterium]
MKEYCAYQERSMLDVKTKLKTFHLHEGMDEQIIIELKKEKFLDEARFAKVFASGKIRINKWGKIKIYAALQQKKVPEFFILQGLNEIDKEEYLGILKNVIESKNKLLKDKDLAKRKQKLAKFAAGKGFESDMVWKVINKFEFKA